jgi:DNA excision repair protein ERCC-2
MDEALGPAEMARLCEEMKKHTRAGQSGGCRHYENFRRKGPEWWKRYLTGEVPTAEELIERCERLGCCPREVMRSMLPMAHLVVAPYNYILAKDVREKLLEQMQVEIEDLIIIVDEAHTLPDRAREEESFSIDAGLITGVRQERKSFGNPRLAPNLTLDKFLEALFVVLADGAGRCEGKDSVEVGREFLIDSLKKSSGLDYEGLTALVANLFNHGQTMIEVAVKEGKEPPTSTLHLAERLTSWSSVEATRFLFLARNGEQMGLEAVCLDPCVSLDVFRSCHASVHMSGTLRPLTQYVQVVGLGDRAVRRTFESPFPKENRLVLCARDINASYESMRDDAMADRMKDHIVRLCNEVGRNTMVFFPSYRVMRQLSLRGLEGGLRGKVYKEEQGMSQERLMGMVERFKQERGAVLLTVMGGRVAEGLDFPEEELELAIIAGIPYPSPTLTQQRLRELYDKRYGKGWEYAADAPAVRKMLQAMGRLIRNENDVGACIILDNRASRFRSQIDLRLTDDPAGDVLRFFEGRPTG